MEDLKKIIKKSLSVGHYSILWILIAGVLILVFGLLGIIAFFKSSNPSLPASTTPATDYPSISPPLPSPETESTSKDSTQKSIPSSSSRSSTDSSTSQTPSANSQTTPQLRYLVALGDSITRAANLTPNLIGDHPEYSFSTGTKINSLFVWLKNKGENLKAVNLAVGGAKSEDVLNQQVPKVSQYNPKFITLLVGGNDMLSLLSGDPVTLDQFQTNLSNIASQITAPGRKVLIGTVPNYSVMWQAEYPACANYAYPPDLVATVIQEYNNVISTVASQYGLILVDLYPYLDAGDISEYDCLHPNISGQQKIANRFIASLSSF